jgi:phosphoribosyl 1,2-cyclic phosphodiesterase
MVTLDVINSGSQANGYVLQDEKEAIILECGCPLLECEKVLDFKVEKVKAVLLTHEHGDHARFAKQYASNALRICSTTATLDAIGLKRSQRLDLEPKAAYRFGGFLVVPFRTQHDAVDPVGFLIDCPDGNRVVFATDTYYLKYTFPMVNYFMMECNYSKEKLQSNVTEGLVHPAVARRIRESHMSLDRCISTLQANDLSQTKGIILLHTSRDNSAEKNLITESVQKATGKVVIIAEKSTKITFL